MKGYRKSGAFTLIEVIAALGILGGGLVVVMAMFAPLARVGGANADLLAATEAGAAVNALLRQMPFETAVGAMASTFVVDRSGEIIGTAEDPVWRGHEEQKFFSVTLTRSEGLSGPGDPLTLPWLAFNLRVRWPVAAVETVAQREIVLPGSVRR